MLLETTRFVLLTQKTFEIQKVIFYEFLSTLLFAENIKFSWIYF